MAKRKAQSIGFFSRPIQFRNPAESLGTSRSMPAPSAGPCPPFTKRAASGLQRGETFPKTSGLFRSQELGEERARVIHIPEGLDNALEMNHHGTIDLILINETRREGLEVSVEEDPHELARPVDD